MSGAVIKDGPKATPLQEIGASRDIRWMEESSKLILELVVKLTPHSDGARAHLDAMMEIGDQRLGQTRIDRLKDGTVEVTVRLRPKRWEKG